jgi:hypothetical protein
VTVRRQPGSCSRELEPVRTRAVILPEWNELVAIKCSGADDWTYETVLDAAAGAVLEASTRH